MTALANEIRPVGLPVYCSACFNQDPGLTHVDFDAACDRGFGDRDDGLKIAMDDLVVCENCLRSGASLIGMQDRRELQDELESLQRRLGSEQRRADELEDYCGKLEMALDARPSPVIAPRRRGRPPKEDE